MTTSVLCGDRKVNHLEHSLELLAAMPAGPTKRAVIGIILHSVLGVSLQLTSKLARADPFYTAQLAAMGTSLHWADGGEYSDCPDLRELIAWLDTIIKPDAAAAGAE